MKFIWVPAFLIRLMSLTAGCKLSEFQCSNGRCILVTQYCDGVNDCGNNSDEPRFCTPCNRTYYGDVGKTYELEIHRPKEDKMPFICHLTFSAGEGSFGDIVQLTFHSFTIGTFSSFLKDGCPDGYLEILEADRPQVGGKWCGTSWGPTLYYSETKKVTAVLALWRLANEQAGYNFDVRIYYKMLNKNSAVVRFGGATPNPFDSERYTNNSVAYHLPSPTPASKYYLGDLISGTYCSRIFSDCNEKACRLQSPNFPGVYPRNLTCYYAVRQHKIPPGKHAVISVRQPNGQLVSIRSSPLLYARTQQQQTDQHERELKVWSDCNEVQDYVTIYDGYTTRDAALLKFCGGREPVPEVTSSGPELLVEFTTSPYGTFLSRGPAQSFHGFQLEVEVLFLNQESLTYTRNKRCEFILKGSGRGVLESPRHSLSPNTTCTYHLEGGENSKLAPTFRPTPGRYPVQYDPKYWQKQIVTPPPSYRVWLSVLKFEISPPLELTQEPCAIKLLIWDGIYKEPPCYDAYCEDKHKGVGKKSNVTLLAKYCRDQIPRTCDHELLTNHSRRPRPCSLTESFLSEGNSMTIQLRLQEATALRRVSFKALYEFVDLHQDGEAFGEGPCSRKFKSQGQKTNGAQKFQSPKDVFLFGRGGNTNLSCIYRFEGQKGEKIKINLQNLEIGSRSCKSLYHPDINKVLCHGNVTASVRFIEFPQSKLLSIPRECFCSSGEGLTPFSFTSSGHLLEIRFEVFNMNATDDFKSFHFEGSWEFVRQSVCTRNQALKGPSGEIIFESPSRTPEEINCEYQPWIIEPTKGKYLYVTAKGVDLNKNSLTYEDIQNNVSKIYKVFKCETQNRILIYAGGELQAVVCPRPSISDKHSIAEVFSNGWRNDLEDGKESALRFLIDEASEKELKAKSIVVEYLGKESGRFSINWLELGRRKSILPPEGYVMKDCIHRCPELDACINSSLWCDGSVHCPSGYDESVSHCYLIFQLPVLYLVFGAIGIICLATAVSIAFLKSCIRKRRRRKSAANILPSESSLFDDKEVIC